MNNPEFFIARWIALSVEDRNMTRKIAALNYKYTLLAHSIQTSIVMLLILVPMVAVVLTNQYTVDQYTKTVCNVTAPPKLVYCAAFKPACGRAEAVDLLNNRSVILRFPSHTPSLVAWLSFDVVDWLTYIQGREFPCYVRDLNGSTIGVAHKEVPGLNGWRFAAGLCGGFAILCIGSITWFVLRGGKTLEEINNFSRTHPNLAPFVRWFPDTLEERHVVRWKEEQEQRLRTRHHQSNIV